MTPHPREYKVDPRDTGSPNDRGHDKTRDSDWRDE